MPSPSISPPSPSPVPSEVVRRAFPAALPFVMLPLELALAPPDRRNAGGSKTSRLGGGQSPEVPAGAREKAFLCVAEAVRASGPRFVEVCSNESVLCKARLPRGLAAVLMWQHVDMALCVLLVGGSSAIQAKSIIGIEVQNRFHGGFNINHDNPSSPPGLLQSPLGMFNVCAVVKMLSIRRSCITSC